MTLETKKTIALIGSALTAIVVIAGNILMAIQIKIQGSGFYVSYLFYSLAILAGGMFLTWIPRMKNHNYGFRLEEGKLRWRKSTSETDTKRTRLVFWPWITIFFELFGMFSFFYDLWNSSIYNVLKIVFLVFTLLVLISWLIIVMVEDAQNKKKSSNQM